MNEGGETGKGATTVGPLRVMVVGVGGQGVVLCARLISETVASIGSHAVMSEVHGMSQRGGVVETTVVINGGDSPMIHARGADLVIATEPLEALRARPWMEPDGAVVVWMTANPPVTVSMGGPPYPSREAIMAGVLSSTGRLFILEGEGIESPGDAPVRPNTALLGAAVRAGTLPFGLDDLCGVVSAVVPGRFVDGNIESIRMGYEGVEHVEAG